MAPGRKQKHAKVIKHSNAYVHPSLASASSPRQSPASQTETSVSERIEYLRRVQTPRLSVFERDQQASVAAPRISNRGRILPNVAGPRPPPSWTDASVTFKHGSASGYLYERRPPSLEYFPGFESPPVTGLLHQAIKALAINFDWHREYDHFYLATLPVSQKELLLSYIARYGPEDGVGIDGLRLLFSSQHELDALSAVDDSPLFVEATGSEDLDRLDLGGLIGRKSLIKQLEKYWTVRTKATESPPEQWDSIDEACPPPGLTPSIRSSLRFPALTKLSLAYPGRDASWTELLHFSRHLGALTHLSLARWPTPRRNNTIFNETAKVQAPKASLSAEADLDDAIDTLRQLSRNTPSLRYLSLAGCETWFAAMHHVTPATETAQQPRSARRVVREFGNIENDDAALGSSNSATAERFVDFTGHWRHIAQLDLTQATPPPPGIDVGYLTLLRMAAIVGPWSAYSGRARRDYTNSPSWERPFDDADATRLSQLAVKAHMKLRLMRSHVAESEGYRIVAPNVSVAEQMKQRERVRTWCERECDALEVAWFVRAQRIVAKGKGIEALHGWPMKELLEIGYDESELLERGFRGD